MNQKTIMIVGVVVVGLLAAGWMVIPAGSPLSDYVKMGDGSIGVIGDIGIFGQDAAGALIDIGAITALQTAYLGEVETVDLVFVVSWNITLENIKVDEDLRLAVGVKLHSVEIEETGANFTDITTVARDIFVGEDVVLDGSLSYSLINDIFAGEEEVLETMDDVFVRIFGAELDAEYTFAFHFNVTVDVRGYTELTPIIGDLFGESKLMWAVASADVDITVATSVEEEIPPASAFNVNIPVDMSNKMLVYGVFVVAIVLVVGGYLIKTKPQVLQRRRRRK